MKYICIPICFLWELLVACCASCIIYLWRFNLSEARDTFNYLKPWDQPEPMSDNERYGPMFGE